MGKDVEKPLIMDKDPKKPPIEQRLQFLTADVIEKTLMAEEKTGTKSVAREEKGMEKRSAVEKFHQTLREIFCWILSRSTTFSRKEK